MSGYFSAGELLGEQELTLERALELFETVYMASRNLAARTRIEYKADIYQLVRFLKWQGVDKPHHVGLSHLQAFLADLDAQGLSGITRRRKVASIKALFHFLVASDLIRNNPTRELIPPEREYKEPRFLTVQEYQALVRSCSHNPRDAAIIELLLQTGIRLSEIARLTIQNVELPSYISRDAAMTGSLTLAGKGRTHRALPLNYKACQRLKAWLALRPPVDHPALFLTKAEEAMGPRAIERVVEKYVKKVGLQDASVRTLRHTFATHHVAHGTDLKIVQEALGHADLKSTVIYALIAKNAMKKDLQNNAL